MEGGGRKRGGTSGASTGGKGARESESFQTGVGSKSKPCTKFFSTAGCPFGEGCHFLHHFPGGHQAVAKMSNLGGPTFAHPPGRMPIGSAVPDGPPTPTVKTRLCNKYNTAEGCKWGDKCHFAHGERELGKHTFIDSSIPPHMGPRPTSHFAPPAMPNPGMVTPASFGASATAKISVDGSLAGAIIGRGGINTKQISRATGAKLAIRDHESDDSLKNIELEGTFDQIKNASAMVTDLIVSISGNNAPPPAKNPAAVSHRGGGPGGNFKTKLCENFTKGSCTFGDRCHFAHGENELRKSSAAASSISMTSARGQEGNDDGARNRSRMRIKYSRDFLLAVGGSEACRRGKPLPADMHASVLIMAGMQLWSMDPTTATADQLQAKTSTETGDEEARGGDGTAAGSSDGAPEPDALQIGVRSKSKACTGFFSTAGCRSGENCLFVHNITVDYQTVADVRVLGSPTTPAHPPRSIPTGPPVPDGPPTPTVQAAPCNSAHTERELDKPSTAGCCYGEKCRFIHNFPGGYQAAADPPGSISLGPDVLLTPTDERELGKHMPKDNSVPPLREQRPTDHCTPQQAPTPGMASAASFGASATAKISVDASLTGVIVGRGGVNIKQISRASGAKVCIRDHESDTNLKNVELQGTFDQIKNASTMVMELIGIGGSDPSLSKDPAAGGGGSHCGGGPGGSFKTKLCGHFARGLCTHGDGCSFAHGVSELRKLVVSPRDRSGGW